MIVFILKKYKIKITNTSYKYRRVGLFNKIAKYVKEYRIIKNNKET